MYDPIHNCACSFSTDEGSGSRCCYDERHHLMYAGDSEYGSRSDRAHEWGRHPYSTPPYIPSVSHWVRDMSAWFYCCQWQDNKNDCFDKYHPQRKTADCSNYQPTGYGSVHSTPANTYLMPCAMQHNCIYRYRYMYMNM